MEKIVLYSEGEWGIPIIKPVDEDIARNIHKIEWFTFKDAKSHYMKDKDPSKCGVHFYLDDQWFNAVWSNPYKYLDFFKKFACVHTPDFSMYRDFPLSVQLYNHYRSMWLGAWWQHHGINVIPTMQYSAPLKEFCFDGVPKNSVVSMSTVGLYKDPVAWKMIKEATKVMIDKIDPMTILWRGIVPEEFSYYNIVKINDSGDLHFKERHTNSKKKVECNG